MARPKLSCGAQAANPVSPARAKTANFASRSRDARELRENLQAARKVSDRFGQTTPPSVHQMIQTLELKGFIQRTPGEARSIRLLVRPEYLPILE